MGSKTAISPTPIADTEAFNRDEMDSSGCRRDLCWNGIWRNPRGNDITASCGELNDLIGRLLDELRQPSTLRIVTRPEASKAQNDMAAVCAEVRTVWILIRRLNSSYRRSIVAYGNIISIFSSAEALSLASLGSRCYLCCPVVSALRCPQARHVCSAMNSTTRRVRSRLCDETMDAGLVCC